MVNQDFVINLPIFENRKTPLFCGFPSAKLASLFQRNFQVYLACSLEMFSEVVDNSAIKLARHSLDPIFHRTWSVDDPLVFNWQQNRLGCVPLLVCMSLKSLLNIERLIDVQCANELPLHYSEPVIEHFQQLNSIGLHTSFIRSVFPSDNVDCFANHGWLPIQIERDVIDVTLDPRLSNDESLRLMRHLRSTGFRGSIQRSNLIAERQARDGCYLGNGRSQYTKARRSTFIAGHAVG